MEQRSGLVTVDDLTRYEARWTDPVEIEFRGYGLHTRSGLSEFPAVVARLPELRGLEEPERGLALVGALLDEPPGQNGTTNVSVIDDEGNACALTTSLGLGSGDFLPGLDLHLNSMLGEGDLVREPLVPAGWRGGSDYAPPRRCPRRPRARRGPGRRDPAANGARRRAGGHPRRRPRFGDSRRAPALPSRRCSRQRGAGRGRGRARAARRARLVWGAA